MRDLPDPAARDHDDVERQRLELLFRTVPAGIVASFAVATVAVVGLWPFSGGTALLAWYLASLAFSMTALVMSRVFRRRVLAGADVARLERYFAASSSLRGALWGLVALIPGGASFLPNVVEVFVIGGVAIGAVGVFGASAVAFVAFVAPLLVIPMIHFFSVGTPPHPAMGILTAVLGATLAFVYSGYHRTLVGGLRQRGVTARLAAEQRVLFESAGVGIAVIKNDRIVDANRQLFALLRIGRDALIGRPAASLAADESGWGEVWRALGAGKAREELPLRCGDGRIVWCDLSAAAIDPARPDDGVVCIVADISSRREADAALHTALAEKEAILEASVAGIALVRDARVVDANRRMSELFGHEGAALDGLPLRTLFASDAAYEEAMARANAELALGRPFQHELGLVRRDGSAIWCLVQGRALRPAYPEGGLILLFSDITERRHAEEALRESEERLDLVVAASQSGVWDWDMVARRTHYSARFKELLGYPPDVDLSELFFLPDRLHPEDRDRVLAAQDAAIRTLVPFDEEYRLRRADGTYVWVRGAGRAQAGPAGQAVRFVGSIHDVSDRRRVEARLRDSESHFRRLVETSNELIWEIDLGRRWTYVSPRATRQLFGVEPDALVGHAFTALQPEDERARSDEMLARVLAGELVSRFETAMLDSLGERVSLSFNATPVRDDAGRVVGASGTATHIGDRLRREAELAAALAEQELIFEAASEGIVFEQDGIVRKCNRMFASMLGYRPEDLIGQLTSVWFADPADFERTAIASARRIRNGQLYERELRVARKDGEVFWCEVRGQAVRPGSLAGGTIWVYSDISERKATEERIRHLANHDALTGLPNRRLLEDRLQQAVGQARRKQSLAAVMLVDLDGFKLVNDRFGHRMGDRVLAAVGARLKRCVRETDTVARMGGDEFVVVLSDQRNLEDAATVAEKILSTVAEPIPLGEQTFEIGASIGISLYPRDGATADELLRQADIAMYQVKDAGKNRFQFYRSGTAAPRG